LIPPVIEGFGGRFTPAKKEPAGSRRYVRPLGDRHESEPPAGIDYSPDFTYPFRLDGKGLKENCDREFLDAQIR
jgi:hypothetical protein